MGYCVGKKRRINKGYDLECNASEENTALVKRKNKEGGLIFLKLNGYKKTAPKSRRLKFSIDKILPVVINKDASSFCSSSCSCITLIQNCIYTLIICIRDCRRLSSSSSWVSIQLER